MVAEFPYAVSIGGINDIHERFNFHYNETFCASPKSHIANME